MTRNLAESGKPHIFEVEGVETDVIRELRVFDSDEVLQIIGANRRPERTWDMVRLFHKKGEEGYWKFACLFPGFTEIVSFRSGQTNMLLDLTSRLMPGENINYFLALTFLQNTWLIGESGVVHSDPHQGLKVLEPQSDLDALLGLDLKKEEDRVTVEDRNAGNVLAIVQTGEDSNLTYTQWENFLGKREKNTCRIMNPNLFMALVESDLMGTLSEIKDWEELTGVELKNLNNTLRRLSHQLVTTRP